MKSKKKQVKVYAAESTMMEWNAICKEFPTNSAAFAAIIHQYFLGKIIGEDKENHRILRPNDFDANSTVSSC